MSQIASGNYCRRTVSPERNENPRRSPTAVISCCQSDDTDGPLMPAQTAFGRSDLCHLAKCVYTRGGDRCTFRPSQAPTAYPAKWAVFCDSSQAHEVDWMLGSKIGCTPDR